MGHKATRPWCRSEVGYGSWLCENAKTLNRDRRSYSSKTALVAQRESGFNLECELKNIILRRVSIFEFLHSQGQTQKSECATGKSALPSTTGIVSQTCQVRKGSIASILPCPHYVRFPPISTGQQTSREVSLVPTCDIPEASLRRLTISRL